MFCCCIVFHLTSALCSWCLSYSLSLVLARLIHGTLAVSPSNIQSHVHLSASTTWRKIFGEENVSSYTLHICRSYVHGDKKKRVVWRQLVRTPVLTPNDVDQYKFWWIGIAFLLFLPLRHMLVRMCWTLYHRTKT